MECNKEELYKHFSYRGVTIARIDYESMPCSMFALGMSDDQMLKIAKDTYDLLLSNGWEDKDIGMICRDYEENSPACMITMDFWRFMEKAAVENGMMYYEDMEDNRNDVRRTDDGTKG